MNKQETINKAIKYAKSLIGIKYSYWTLKKEKDGKFNMMYNDSNDKVPPIEEVKKNGINCAGLINLMRRKVGLKVKDVVAAKNAIDGGTYAWFSYLNKKKKLHKFNYKEKYPKGTLLIRKYANEKDQGHVAVVMENKSQSMYSKLIHAWTYESYSKGKKFFEPGVDNTITVGQSHFHNGTGYYTHYCLPEDWLVKE